MLGAVALVIIGGLAVADALPLGRLTTDDCARIARYARFSRKRTVLAITNAVALVWIGMWLTVQVSSDALMPVLYVRRSDSVDRRRRR